MLLLFDKAEPIIGLGMKSGNIKGGFIIKDDPCVSSPLKDSGGNGIWPGKAKS